MNAARELLDDLAVIGATVEPAGDRLILRAGPTAIPAKLVNRVREAKADLIATLARHEACEQDPSSDSEPHACVVEWLKVIEGTAEPASLPAPNGPSTEAALKATLEPTKRKPNRLMMEADTAVQDKPRKPLPGPRSHDVPGGRDDRG